MLRVQTQGSYSGSQTVTIYQEETKTQSPAIEQIPPLYLRLRLSSNPGNVLQSSTTSLPPQRLSEEEERVIQQNLQAIALQANRLQQEEVDNETEVDLTTLVAELNASPLLSPEVRVILEDWSNTFSRLDPNDPQYRDALADLVINIIWPTVVDDAIEEDSAEEVTVLNWERNLKRFFNKRFPGIDFDKFIRECGIIFGQAKGSMAECVRMDHTIAAQHTAIQTVAGETQDQITNRFMSLRERLIAVQRFRAQMIAEQNERVEAFTQRTGQAIQQLTDQAVAVSQIAERLIQHEEQFNQTAANARAVLTRCL